MLRIPIREQLASLVLLTTLTGLAVIAIATWILDYNRIKTLGVYYLGLTASLKAAQLSSNLDLMERSVRSLSTRVRVQTALTMYNNGTNATATWNQFASDLGAALAAPGSDVLTLQVAVFALNGTVPGIGGSLLNVTGNTINVTLPNGGQLGDAVGGYPANLYPNLTFGPTPGQTGQGNSGFYNGQVLGADAAIFLGPWSTNATFALSSITLPVISTTTLAILGFMTIVLDSRLIFDVLNSPVGLGSTGVSLLVGPFTVNNEFDGFPYQLSLPIQSNASTIIDSPVRFVLPPNETYSSKRHNLRAYGQPGAGNSFNMADYPLVRRAATIDDGEINNAGGTISTQNEQGITVSAGYAIPSSKLVDWILILEESKAEVYAPIDKLRKVLLGCVFGTALGIILLVIPLAHYSSRPIRRLRDATAKSIIRLGSHPSSMVEKDPGAQHVSSPASQRSSRQETTGKWPSIFVKSFRRSTIQEQKYPRPSTLKHSYPIPDAVQARRTWVQDELSDLTYYFNEMSDELVLFYGKLEERVRSRTAELEMAKKAAEAANESKTLFIANISHELKTPLNGILGMCAVCMQEDDPVKIKRSLGIIYKSGDLLHNLLTDLLTFSKNQTGQIQLVQSEFPLRDIGIQVKAIFENQAREGQVNFSIAYEGCRDSLGSTIDEVKKDYGPPGTGRVKDMHLFGDMQRVLQVVINLVSNSLKFTPQQGSVSLKIRCLDTERAESVRTGRSPSRKGSSYSKTSTSKKFPRLRIMSRNDSNTSPPPELQDGLPHLIDPTIKEDNRSRTSMMSASDQAGVNGAPYNAHTLHFEFEVEDTGPGIAPHLQQKIFEPFVQGDLRLTKKFGGTGLGLSICSQLSKLMGGSISLESTEGVGSKFTLHLPLKLVRSRSDSNATSPVDGDSRRSSMSFGEHSASHHTPSRPHTKDSNTTTAPSASADPAYFDVDSKTRLVGLSQPYFSTSKAPLASPSTDDTKKAESSRLRVLVAEDNTVNQEVVVRMLRLEEIFDVHLAKDGQEALDKVKESMEKGEQYDLIFMDVQMPRIDGRESTREIRKLGYNRPIVALTAFADDINKKECLDSGMSDFMAKPIRRPALKHVLKTYCPPPPIAEVDETGSLGGSSPALLGKGAQDPFAKSVNGQAAKDLETSMVSPGSEVPRKAT